MVSVFGRKWYKPNMVMIVTGCQTLAGYLMVVQWGRESGTCELISLLIQLFKWEMGTTSFVRKTFGHSRVL